MKRLSPRQFTKIIDEMKPGEYVFINTINCMPATIDALRDYIELGILIPDTDEVAKHVTTDSIIAVMTGSMICPQMFYIKSREEGVL